MFLIGLSSRILLRQAHLFSNGATQDESGWLTADDSGDLIATPQKLHNLSFMSFLLPGFILAMGAVWHTVSLIFVCIWALVGTQNLPYTVEEIHAQTHRLRRRSTFFGLHWYENEATEEVVALTLVSKLPRSPREATTVSSR